MDASIIGFVIVLAACLGVLIIFLLDRDTRMKRVAEFFGRLFAVLGIVSAVAACVLSIIGGGTIVFQLARCGFHSCFHPILDFPLPTAKSGPAGITLGPDGDLWFTEADGNRIGRITVNTEIVTEYPLPTANSRPLGITAGPDGALWFTEEVGNRIGRMTTSGQLTEFSLPTAHSAPQHIVAGPDGAVWFTENQGDKIGRMTTSGQLIEFSLSHASGPSGIVAGPDGALWFTEASGNRVGRITTAGAITEFPLPTANSHPSSITPGPDRALSLWFTENPDDNTGRIGRITASGQVTEFPLPAHSKPGGITAEGNLWYTESHANEIEWINTDGEFDGFAIPTANSTPDDITHGPDDALWFTENQGNKIGRITMWLAA